MEEDDEDEDDEDLDLGEQDEQFIGWWMLMSKAKVAGE